MQSSVVRAGSRKAPMRIAGLILALMLPLVAACKILPQGAVQPPPSTTGQDSGVAAEPAKNGAGVGLRPKPRPAPLTQSAGPDREEEPALNEAVAAEPEPLKSKDQVLCEKRGGNWSNAGKSNSKTCIQRTRDAGKQCRKKGDCSSACLARSGSCAPFKPLFGCNEILQKDGSRVTLCIE